MHKAAALVSLLVLGWSGTLQGLSVIPEPSYKTQENFHSEQVRHHQLPSCKFLCLFLLSYAQYKKFDKENK